MSTGETPGGVVVYLPTRLSPDQTEPMYTVLATAQEFTRLCDDLERRGCDTLSLNGKTLRRLRDAVRGQSTPGDVA